MEELLSLCKQDRNGFFDLNDIVSKTKLVRTGWGVSIIKVDGKKYYIKSDVRQDYDKYSRLLAKNDYKLIAEVVNSKVQKRLGVKTIDNHFAKFGKNFAVISEDLSSIYKGCTSLTSFMGYNRFIRPSVEEIKDNWHVKTKGTSKFIKDIEMIPFVHATTGQLDGHTDNLLVYYNSNNEAKGLVYLDNEDSTVSEKKYGIDYFKVLYREKEFSPVMLPMGLNNTSQTLSGLYNSIVIGSSVSDSTITEYLHRMEKMLHDDNCLRSINDEIVEEYGKPIPQDYYNKLKFVMESVAEGVNEAYEMRLAGDFDM